MCNMFFVVTYIPHNRTTHQSTVTETIRQIQTLLSKVCKSDWIILSGDFNCQLQHHVKNYTVEWCMTTRADNGNINQVLDLMRSLDLFAVDTLFKPARKTWGQSKRTWVCNTTTYLRYRISYLQKTDVKTRTDWLSYGLSPCKQFSPDPTGVNRCEACVKK